MSLFNGHDLLCIRGERRVFAGLGFTLRPGEALILSGPNGSGKSSLLRLMAGLLKPASGSLAWDGEETKEDPEAHNGRLHYIGHLDAVKPVLSVAENLSFWASLRSAGPSPGAGPAAALEAFGIANLAEVPGRFLSAGQKRRLNLARVLAAPAPLWLLDEPATALDRDAIARLEKAIRIHRATGGMVVASTHAEIGLEGAEVLELDRYAAGEVPGQAAW
mgnify:CR=1 FL=1